MEVAGPFVAIITIGVLLGILIQTCLLLLGARFAGIENRTFAKAIGATILIGLAEFVLSLVLKDLAVSRGPMLCFIGVFPIAALIVMAIFSTTFFQALGATLVALVFGPLVMSVMFLFGKSVGGLPNLARVFG